MHIIKSGCSFLKQLIQGLVGRCFVVVVRPSLLFHCLQELLYVFLAVEYQAVVRLKQLCLVDNPHFAPRSLLRVFLFVYLAFIQWQQVEEMAFSLELVDFVALEAKDADGLDD